MKVGEFSLDNQEKVERALHGSLTRNGQLSGGVGDEAKEMELLAEYDKLGGLVTKNGIKVKSGSFFDFKKKVARKEPEVTFLSEIDGSIVELDEEEAKAVKVAREKIKGLKAKKLKKEVVKKDEKDESEEEAPVKIKRVKEVVE